MNHQKRNPTVAPVRGFTVLEVLLAATAFVLLAGVILSVLRVIEKTQSAGTTLSNKTEVGAMLERRLRLDFDRMTRDGFLVIRNKVTPSPVALDAGQQARPRRIDEILFFANVPAKSLRSPLDTRRSPESPTSMVYLGHGLPRGSAQAALINDSNAGAATFGQPGPSQYAKGWVLALQQLALVSPVNPPVQVQRGTATAPIPAELDSAVQIALQPAAPSIFRFFNPTVVAVSPPITGLRGQVVPNLASGTIDVVAQDLSTIRQLILAGDRTAQYGKDLPAIFPPPGIDNNQTSALVPPLTPAEREVMAMMLEAFPADSDAGRRLRVENDAPIIGTLTGDPRVDQSIRDDSVMTMASRLLPGVSEFIVEWSFGLTAGRGAAVPEGTVLWHGMDRIDEDGLDVLPFTGVWTGGAYGVPKNLITDKLVGSTRVVDETAVGGTNALAAEVASGTPKIVISSRDQRMCILYPRLSAGGLKTPQVPGLHEMSFERIHGQPANFTQALDSYFGYLDLRYRPDPTLLARDVNGDGIYQPLDGDLLADPDTLPAAWPARIRVTIKYAAPSAPAGSEQTFQFVFKTPGVFPGMPR